MARTGRPKSRDVTRSEKLMLYLTPDVFDDFKKLSCIHEKTMNDYCAELIEEAVKANAERIEAFKAIQKTNT